MRRQAGLELVLKFCFKEWTFRRNDNRMLGDIYGVSVGKAVGILVGVFVGASDGLLLSICVGGID
eukprot:12180270-Ditylum_brightwellii.AAC.1